MENLEQKNNSNDIIKSDNNDINEKKPSLFWEIIKFAIFAIIIVLPIRMFIASPFIVSGSSMIPTFATGNYLFVDKVSYRFEDPARGDIVVFRYPLDTSKFFIKRVIGLPKETVEIQDGIVSIKNSDSENYTKLIEPYVKYLRYSNFKVTLGNDEYFVMGDNRKASSDSRIWGPLQAKFITGKALVRLFPITKVGVYPGESSY